MIGILKGREHGWARSTDLFVKFELNICAGAGSEFETLQGRNGKASIEKVGTKMKTKARPGRPELLVLMGRSRISGPA